MKHRPDRPEVRQGGSIKWGGSAEAALEIDKCEHANLTSPVGSMIVDHNTPSTYFVRVS